MNLADLRADKYRGSVPKLPMCQFLLTKGKTKDTGFEAQTPILFVKDESVRLSGWVEMATGKPYTHVYGNGNKENGIAFASPRINFLASSPRLIQVTEKGAENGLGIKGEIVGNYDLPNGADMRATFPKGSTTLRTLHMLYLVGEDNTLLHKVPLTLSIHGGAATFLGKQLDLFYRQLEVVYSEAQDSDEFFTLGKEARCLAAFEPHLELTAVGEEQTSDIPAVVGYKEPRIETLESIFNFQNADRIYGVRQSLSNFAERYLVQFQEYHPVGNLDQLELESSVDIMTFEITKTDNPLSMVLSSELDSAESTSF